MRRTVPAALATLALTLAVPSATRAAGRADTLLALSHGTRAERRVALTFDLCTTRDPTPFDARIPAILDRLGVPATIFVGGGWAMEEPMALERLAADPLFELGNHTFSHPHLTRDTDAQIRDELLRTQAAIAARTGRAPTLFRPPFGEYDSRVVRDAAALGLATVEYDLPSGDPDPHLSKDAIVRWVLRAARPGSIVVMHMNHPRFHTAEALPEIVEGLRARGFELVQVSELRRPASLPPSATVAISGPKAPATRGARALPATSHGQRSQRRATLQG